MINSLLWPVPSGYEILEDINFIDSILFRSSIHNISKEKYKEWNL